MDFATVSKLCRLCATPKVDPNSAENLSAESPERKMLLAFVDKYLRITITENESLPPKFCPECTQKLHAFDAFSRRCDKVQEMFIRCLEVQEIFNAISKSDQSTEGLQSETPNTSRNISQDSKHLPTKTNSMENDEGDKVESPLPHRRNQKVAKQKDSKTSSLVVPFQIKAVKQKKSTISVNDVCLQETSNTSHEIHETKIDNTLLVEENNKVHPKLQISEGENDANHEENEKIIEVRVKEELDCRRMEFEKGQTNEEKEIFYPIDTWMEPYETKKRKLEDDSEVSIKLQYYFNCRYQKTKRNYPHGESEFLYFSVAMPMLDGVLFSSIYGSSADVRVVFDAGHAVSYITDAFWENFKEFIIGTEDRARCKPDRQPTITRCYAPRRDQDVYPFKCSVAIQLRNRDDTFAPAMDITVLVISREYSFDNTIFVGKEALYGILPYINETGSRIRGKILDSRTGRTMEGQVASKSRMFDAELRYWTAATLKVHHDPSLHERAIKLHHTVAEQLFKKRTEGREVRWIPREEPTSSDYIRAHLFVPKELNEFRDEMIRCEEETRKKKLNPRPNLRTVYRKRSFSRSRSRSRSRNRLR